MTGADFTNTLSKILASVCGASNYSSTCVFWKTRIFLVLRGNHGGLSEETAVVQEGSQPFFPPFRPRRRLASAARRLAFWALRTPSRAAPVLPRRAGVDLLVGFGVAVGFGGVGRGAGGFTAGAFGACLAGACFGAGGFFRAGAWLRPPPPPPPLLERRAGGF